MSSWQHKISKYSIQRHDMSHIALGLTSYTIWGQLISYWHSCWGRYLPDRPQGKKMHSWCLLKALALPRAQFLISLDVILTVQKDKSTHDWTEFMGCHRPTQCMSRKIDGRCFPWCWTLFEEKLLPWTVKYKQGSAAKAPCSYNPLPSRAQECLEIKAGLSKK